MHVKTYHTVHVYTLHMHNFEHITLILAVNIIMYFLIAIFIKF